MKESYGDTAKIKYNKKTKAIEIIPTDKYYMYGIEKVKNGDKECIAIWNKTVDNIIETSKYIDKEYLLTIRQNNNILLMVQNEIVVYNCVNKKI